MGESLGVGNVRAPKPANTLKERSAQPDPTRLIVVAEALTDGGRDSRRSTIGTGGEVAVQ